MPWPLLRPPISRLRSPSARISFDSLQNSAAHPLSAPTSTCLPASTTSFPAVNWPNCAAVRLRYDFPTTNPPQHPQWFAVSPQTACHSIPYPIYIMWPMMTPVLSTSNRASPRPRPSNNSHPMSPCLCSAAIVYAMPWVTARSWAGKKLSGTNRFFCAWAMVTASGWNSTVGNVK